MDVPCDMIAQAVAGYLDVGDLITSSCATFIRVLTTMVQGLGPQRSVVQLDPSELTDRVIVGSFVCHLQAHGAPLELPRSSTGASALTTRRPRASA
jgi:hypothetical protein